MRKALRYRLFGMGKMPVALRAAAAGPDVVLASEGLPVTNRVRALQVPGARVSSGVRTASGAVVILPGRLLASIGTYVIASTGLGRDGGNQELVFAEDGVHITFDVASVIERGSGTVEVHYKIPLEAAVLGRLPGRTYPVTLTHAADALLRPWQGSYSSGGPRAAAR